MENKIQLLPPALCDQIAAGEVLERASSAVKELVENSLDAGAKRIEIEIEAGGRSLIRVSDDGSGMSPEDAKLSILRHATSKIRETKDLAAISTLGFRGEALASMAAVSRMSITTQQRNADAGTLVRVEASTIMECRETAAPVGTQISIQDIFFNTPARLKFLKTPATENRRVYEVVEQLALSHPETQFKLTVDGRIKLDTPPHTSLKERILSILGRDVFENMYPLAELPTLGGLTISGLISSPDYALNNTGRLYTFVNHRCVRDKTINAAIQGAYKEFLHGKMPTAVLLLEVPLDKVDVNVHPTKHEIRFEDQDLVFRCVYRAIRETLSKTPWISEEAGTLPPLSSHDDPNIRFDINDFKSPESLSPYARNEFFKPQIPEKRNIEPYSNSTTHSYLENTDTSLSQRSFPKPSAEDTPSEPAFIPDGMAFPSHDDNTPFSPATIVGAGETKPMFQQSETIGYFSSLIYLGQLSNTYLIAIDGDNLVVIDQHAAHERINYEKLKRIMAENNTVCAQMLLFPVILTLDGLLSATLEEHLDFFEKLGFQIDPFGENIFALKAVPDILVGYDYENMIKNALTEMAALGRTAQFQDHIDSILSTMACHRSIRAGMKMDREDAISLFKQMDQTLFKSNCPHGRPVHFILTNDDIEKKFLRK